MARLYPLFSGSSGNSTYISSQSGGILIDAGGSFKAICTALERAGKSVEDICAVAVTHEHTDHIKGLKTLLKKTGIPLISSLDTFNTLKSGDYIPENTQFIQADKGDIQIENIGISYFSTSHDCKGSGGYVISLPDGKKAAVCTDTGVLTEEMKEKISGCDAVLIESNHDVEMLKRGPYPPSLKIRILSDKGHLSNNDCAAVLPALLKSGTTRFVLGHLSRNNNLPMLALSAARATLADVGAVKDSDYILTAAKPDFNEVTVF